MRRQPAIADPRGAPLNLTFVEKDGAKYAKAVAWLTRDGDAPLAFFSFRAEHWDQLRTSSPIEGVFPTVRHRTVRIKGALSELTATLMVLELVMAAAKAWRRLQEQDLLPEVIEGVTICDGVEETPTPRQRAA